MSERRATGAVFLQPAVIIALLVLLFGAYVFGASFTYQVRTGFFARLVSGLLLVLSFAIVVREIRQHRAGRLPAVSRVDEAEIGDELGIEPAEATSAAAEPESRGAGIAVAWLAAGVLGIAIVGHVIALPIWSFLYLRWHRAPIVPSACLAAAAGLLAQLVLVDRLGVFLFDGLVFGARLPRFF